MTLPPVVADPKLCLEAPWQRWDLADPHWWVTRFAEDPALAGRPHTWQEFEVCRFCGGRKP